jgi:hypothetical protein
MAHDFKILPKMLFEKVDLHETMALAREKPSMG